MSQSKPYKELQKEAKKCGIPANMKREFLESALKAFEENDQASIKSIVDFHKNARKRRSIKPAKETVVKPKIKKAKPSQNIVAQLSDITQDDCRFDLTGDDDDCSNFHPDSTSTPNRPSVNNILQNDNHPRNGSPGAFRNLNYSCVSFEPKNHNLTSYFKSVPTLFPRNSVQDPLCDDRNNSCSSYCNAPALRTPFLHQTQSQLCLYDNSNYNFTHENYYSSQAPLNPRYYESDNLVPVSEIGYERVMPRNGGNECSSAYLPNVPQLNDVEEKTPMVRPSWSNNYPYNGNMRINGNTSSYQNIIENDDRVECLVKKVTDTGSISAEFDSNSDTETLSLPDEIANFFDSEIDKKKSSSSFLTPFNYHPKPNVQAEVLQSYNFGNRSILGNNFDDKGAIDCEKSQDSGLGSFPLQPVTSDSEWSCDNQTLLPSVATLLPDYNMSAYCQAYMKPSKSNCDFGSASNYYPPNQFMKSIDKTTFCNGSRNTDEGAQRFDGYENSNYSKNYTIPYLTSNTSQSNNSLLKSYLGNKSSLPVNETSFSEESSVSSSVIEDLPAVSNNLLSMLPLNVLNEAIQEMQNYQIKSNMESYGSSLVSKNATSTELASKQEGTRVVYKRETISIQNTLIEKNVKKDVYCKSLEIQMNKPAENIRMSAVCGSSAQLYGCNSLCPSFRSCKNKMHGCIAMLQNNDSLDRAHEKECMYQIVHCPLDKCDWRGIMKMLTVHIYESHKNDLHIGKDLVYVVNQSDNEEIPFITYFQLYEGTIFVITLHITEKKCVATMQYIPEIETADYRNKRINAVMHLVYFSRHEVESRSWEGEVQPYLLGDETLFQKDNTLQSTIGNSQNLILRVWIV